jgi:hypothetical protein
MNGKHPQLLFETVAFCRVLARVASPTLQPDCLFRCAQALLSLQRIRDAEEVLHEGLVSCPPEGLRSSQVSSNSQAVNMSCGDHNHPILT